MKRRNDSQSEDEPCSKKMAKDSPKTVLTRYLDWSEDELYGFLRNRAIPEEAARILKDNKISGRHFTKLTDDSLTQMGIKELGYRADILDAIKSLNDIKVPFGQEKIFNDPIHGHIELHPLMIKIIDTPQFQRLRHIKQLGGGYYVFMGASHNRFEHSIGVGYLAGELVETLHRKQPELCITSEDILCVKIAGLCHDLGHGPFSHMFDNQFIPTVCPGTKWKHEEASVMMFDHLITVNDLKKDFEKYNLHDKDILFIKEQIAGPKIDSHRTEWQYEGRSEEKSFLYEIVANKRNGIDVDKWDYFARDCHCLGIPNNFDMRRSMKFARVIYVDSRKQICTRDKEVVNLYEMFHTRITLHRRAYQHKTAKIIEYMITEALRKVNDHFLIPGENGPVKMSEAIFDPCAYTRLNDSILQLITMSSDPNLDEAKKLLLKVEKRELYKFVGQTQLSQETAADFSSQDIVKGIIGCMTEDGSTVLTNDDIVVQVVTFDYGMKREDPIGNMRFYKKDNPIKAEKVKRDQVSLMLPSIFMEQIVRVYSKCDREGIKAARKYFVQWCRKHGRTPEDEDELVGDSEYFLTPSKESPLTVNNNIHTSEHSNAKKNITSLLSS